MPRRNIHGKDYFENIRRSTERDYPPKKKKFYFGDEDYLGTETLHSGGFRPADPISGGGAGGGPDGPVTDPCIGRVLRMEDPQISCEDESVKLNVVGSIGNVYIVPTNTSSPCVDGSDLEAEGGSLIIPSSCCSDGDSIDFWYCDDCGCGYKIVAFPNCTDCSPTPEISGADTMSINSTEQYTLSDSVSQVTWEVSGIDAAITQTGQVTTGNDACGTITVTATDACCGPFTKEVRVAEGSDWYLDSTENAVNCPGFGIGEPCHPAVSGDTTIIGDGEFQLIVGGTKYEMKMWCRTDGHECDSNPDNPTGAHCAVCGENPIPAPHESVVWLKTYFWECDP